MELNMEIVANDDLSNTEKLVWHLREMGQSQVQVAKSLNVSERTVSRAVKRLNQTLVSRHECPNQTLASRHSCPPESEPNIILTNSVGVSIQNPSPPPSPQPSDEAAGENEKLKQLALNPEPSVEEWEAWVDPGLWRSDVPKVREDAAVALVRLMRHPDYFEKIIGSPLLDPEPDYVAYKLYAKWCDRVGRLGFNRLGPNELGEVFTLIHRHPHWNEGGRWTMGRLTNLVYKATRKMSKSMPMFRDPLRLIQLTQHGAGQDLAFKIIIDGHDENTIDLRAHATVGRN